MSSAVRGHQVKPTKKEMDAAWFRLRERANEGNLIACALVVALTEASRIQPSSRAAQ